MFYKSWHFFPVTVWNYLNILLGYSCWHFMLSNSFLNEVRATHISSLTDVWYLQTEMSCVTEELKPILKFLQARLLYFPIIQFAWKIHRIPASNEPGATPMILLTLATNYYVHGHYTLYLGKKHFPKELQWNSNSVSCQQCRVNTKLRLGRGLFWSCNPCMVRKGRVSSI